MVLSISRFAGFIWRTVHPRALYTCGIPGVAVKKQSNNLNAEPLAYRSRKALRDTM
jgi:hypothetical protein